MSRWLAGFHSAAVSGSGDLYTWGVSTYGALGLGDDCPGVVKEPEKVELMREAGRLEPAALPYIAQVRFRAGAPAPRRRLVSENFSGRQSADD